MVRGSIGHRDWASGKLFVGSVSWDTTEENFADYFRRYGEITDSIIMYDKQSGRPRGFGFVTFSDPAVADKVLEQGHVIDSREVGVRRRVPREDLEAKGDELSEYFSLYGGIIDYENVLDHESGQFRGFGFVTFENEDAVEQRENYMNLEANVYISSRGDNSGNATTKFDGFDGTAAGHDGYNYGGQYSNKMGQSYGSYGIYDAYGNFGGSYSGNYAGFYCGYDGYLMIDLDMADLCLVVLWPGDIIIIASDNFVEFTFWHRLPVYLYSPADGEYDLQSF
ncbi:Splicing factor-like protein [Parasponia andersonii]|uniref:Splicing factor-like protein n=1 Tax=Parasponia andersonii TaxID=3476 RepID=A0A2P5BH95_PARAD|nr:Splicing factor-like protein [Parasponia andersonii]